MKTKMALVVLLLVTALGLVVKTMGQKTSNPDRGSGERWEYLVVSGPTTTNFSPTGNSRMRKEDGAFAREVYVMETQFDKLGANGWELVSVAGNQADPVYYFKRPK